MRRAPQIITCLLLWFLGGLACDAIPITIPLEDGNKGMPDAGAASDGTTWTDDAPQTHADGMIPPWSDAGAADMGYVPMADGALDGLGDGWPGDGWPGDGGLDWSGEGAPADGTLADGEPSLDGGLPDSVSGD